MGDLTLIGYDVKDGKTPEYLDPRAAACWFAAVDLIKARTGFDLSKRILQALGDAKASAGVHRAPGVCVDIRVWGMTRAQIEEVVALLRECGYAGTWYRDWEGNQHIHAATDIGVWSPALYQITAVKAGYDGLGSGGKQGKDPHPKPSAWRTAQTGAAWAREQLEDDMALSTDDKAWLSNEIARGAQRAVNRALWEPLVPGRTDVGGSSIRNNLLHQSLAASQLVALVSQLAARQGVDVDEAAIASQVAASVAPILRAALVEAVTAGGSPEVIADAVVAKLGAALQD